MVQHITIGRVITEMAMYWSLNRGDELRTRKILGKIAAIHTDKITALTEERLMLLYKLLKFESTGTDESVKRRFRIYSKPVGVNIKATSVRLRLFFARKKNEQQQ